MGLGTLIDEHLSDPWQDANNKFPLADLLRQSVYFGLAGYEDPNDAVRVSTDPTFPLIGPKKNWDRGGAVTSRLQSFESGMLACDENLIGLMAVNRELVSQAEACDESDGVVLDMDSTESPVHGQQEGGAYNGHFESVCYHPLLLSNQHGDCLAAKLRPGNGHSAEDCDELLLPEIERQQAEGKRVTFPGRCRLRQAGDLRGVGRARRRLRDPHSGEQEPGGGDRGYSVLSAGQALAQAPSALQELPLPSRELVETETGCRQGLNSLVQEGTFLLPLDKQCEETLRRGRS